MAQGWSRGAPARRGRPAAPLRRRPGLPRRARPGAGWHPVPPRSAARSAARCPPPCSWSSATGGAPHTSRPPGERPAPARRRPARPRADQHVGRRPLLEAAVEQGAGGSSSGSAAAPRTTAAPGCSPRWGPARPSVLARGGSPWPRRPTTRCRAWPTWSRGCAAPRSCSPPTTRRRCSACRARVPSRRREGRLARAGPRARGRARAVRRRRAVAAAGRPSSCSAGCRAVSTASRAPVRRVAWATACSPSARDPCRRRRARCCARAGSACGGPQRPGGHRRGPASTGALRGSVVAGVAAAALDTGRPTVLVAGRVLVGRRERWRSGWPAPTPSPTAAPGRGVVADPVETLRRPRRAGGAHLVAR